MHYPKEISLDILALLLALDFFFISCKFIFFAHTIEWNYFFFHISEPREIQLKLLQGADFCKEVNELLLRCVTPIKSCFDFSTVTDVANALLHDVVPLNKPKLFANINQGKNCSVLAKQYAAKTAQPLLKSTVCK